MFNLGRFPSLLRPTIDPLKISTTKVTGVFTQWKDGSYTMVCVQHDGRTLQVGSNPQVLKITSK